MIGKPKQQYSLLLTRQINILQFIKKSSIFQAWKNEMPGSYAATHNMSSGVVAYGCCGAG